jgi:diguanylate cyclase (GGDEF)-like protein
MRTRIGIYGATDEALTLVPLLEANPEVEVPVIYDPDPAAVRARLVGLGPDLASQVEARLTDDLDKLAATPALYAVIDAGAEEAFARAAPDAAAAVQVVAPLTARLLWGYGASARDHKLELLQALHEVVESYNLTVDPDELFTRMLEIAVGVTGADRGSLMLLDRERRELTVRVAMGIEPELWSKIRVRLGEGIAGRAVEEGRPLHVRGKADRASFHVVRERLDVESALCVPLVHEGVVLGVLNVHHTTRPDAFSEDDFEFVQQLATLDAQIIARAQEHETLRSQAARYAAVREVRRILAGKSPLLERLGELCQLVARRAGRGIATVYLYDLDEDELRLAATSLAGGGFGGEYRIAMGEGIDGRAAAERRPTFLAGGDDSLAYAALPLCAEERLMGLLSVQTGSEAPRGRTAEEGFQEIAAATADAISQSERETRMHTRATKVGAINEMGIRMLSGTDTAEVVRLATSSGAMILEADHAILRLQDEETGRYVIRSYLGSASGRDQERLFRLDKTVSVDLIKRRVPALVRDVPADPRLGPLEAGVRSLMASPLRREGRLVGSLVFYDKVAADSFYASAFNEDDFQIFAKFVTYVERAVANAAFYSQARRHKSFDEDTGLPNSNYLTTRVDEELARAGGRRHAGFAVAVCRIENWTSLRDGSDPVHQRRVIQRTAEALRDRVRGFDVVARTDEAEFVLLLPDAAEDAGERVAELARGVAEAVSADDALNEPERVGLAFGYAVHPGDGTDAEALLAAARSPRIRMV